MKSTKKKKSKIKAAAKTKAPKSKSVRKPNTKRRPGDQKTLFVYGYGDDALPRAATFIEPDFALARKAAGLLGLKVFVVPTADIKACSKGVRSGNVYASSDGFAPKIPPKRFAELMASLKLTPREPSIVAPAPALPASWQTIAVGDLLLAESDDPDVGGYWETLVEACDEQTLTLRARDFPDVRVKRDRFAVALLYTPAYTGPESLDEAAPGLPTGFEVLKPGHCVLASAGKREGWYPAIVSKIEGQTVTAHWQTELTPTFTRQIADLALLYPNAP